MTDKEKALDIIVKKRVNVALLLDCFEMPDDPFLLKYQPDMCCGLYRYNEAIRYDSNAYPLNIREYNLLKKVLNWRN